MKFGHQSYILLVMILKTKIFLCSKRRFTWTGSKKLFESYNEALAAGYDLYAGKRGKRPPTALKAALMRNIGKKL